jgi:hypothetical protein
MNALHTEGDRVMLFTCVLPDGGATRILRAGRDVGFFEEKYYRRGGGDQVARSVRRRVCSYSIWVSTCGCPCRRQCGS